MQLDDICFFSQGEIEKTYVFFHMYQMDHWKILQPCRSKLEFLFSPGFFRWNFYREGSVGGLRMALPLSLLFLAVIVLNLENHKDYLKSIRHGVGKPL